MKDAAMNEKIIVIELDGATWDIIDPMIAAGQLPHLRFLKEKGAWGRVDTEYLGSPVIWTAIYTGKKKEKFGNAFFGINKTRLQAKRIWEILAERGGRIGVFHSLLTWPPAEVDGFLIPDIFAMGPQTYPQKYSYFQKLYLSRHGKNILKQGYYFFRAFLSCGSLSVFFSLAKFLLSFLVRPEALNTFRRRLMVVTQLDYNLYVKLYRRHRPQLSTFHLHSIDTVSHKYWQFMNTSGRYRDVIHDFYRQADRFIGQVLTLLDANTSLMVVADHGFQDDLDGRGKFGLNLAGLRELLGLDSSVRVVRMGNAFVMNLSPTTEPQQADRYTAQLSEARLGDGSPLFVNVKKIDQNIHFRLNRKILESKAPLEETISFPGGSSITFGELFRKKAFVDTGTHAAGQGVFAVYGPKFKENVILSKVNIFDITPTMLTLLGLPIAEDMDGDFDPRWLTPAVLEALKPEYIPSYEEARPPERPAAVEAYTDGEVEDLEERLKMLGYM
jgi:predicted AlkP superfamily phosphohydrolase/phosphomutase